MPLLNCPDCGQQVSTRAKACPKCAYPINPSVRPAAVPRPPPPTPRAAPPPAVLIAAPPVQTIERTSKALKGQVLASALLAIAGMFMTCATRAAPAQDRIPAIGQFGALLFVGGIVWFIVTRIRIWWHHD